jgi:hypothetical protein
MTSGAGVVAGRLRARRAEIEQAIFARVRYVAPSAAGDRDAEYVAGLRAAVGAAVEFVLTGIERGEERPTPIPTAAVAQAQRAVRSGVSLETVLRRYTAGYTMLGDYVIEEAENAALVGQLRPLLRVQASLLERLTGAIADEYGRELERVRRSHGHRRLELVRALLSGERVDDGGELGYGLDGEHLGVIGTGAGCREALQGLADGLDRRLLCVARGEGSVWAWLGGERSLARSDLRRWSAELQRARPVGTGQEGRNRLGAGGAPRGGGPTGDAEGTRDGPAFAHAGPSFALGEPARGLAGWRLTHRQAQAAQAVALRRPQKLTRYADVALLAAALRDDTLAESLSDIYLAPLDDARNGGVVLRETLRAYLTVEHNVSAAAAVLGVVRSTVENRLRTVEERLGRPVHACLAQLEVALQLEQLGGGADAG